jgi:FkbM family methyltransferase
VHKLAFSLFKRAVSLRRRVKDGRTGRAFDRLLKTLRLDRATIGPHVMHINPLDAGVSFPLLRRGVYEKTETALFKKCISRGMRVLDVGANIGYYTLIAARLVGGNGNVFAFEPEGENFALLKKNVEANGYTNTTLVQKALSDRTAGTEMFLSPANKGDHRIYRTGEGRPSIEIDAVRLDDFFSNPDETFDFIKMDIQGAEPAALRGMTRLLGRNGKLTLVTEFWPSGIRLSGSSPRSFLQELAGHGFHVFVIDEKENRLLSASADGIIRMCPGEKHVNLFCRRVSRFSGLQPTMLGV